MVNVVATSRELQERIEEIVQRNNTKIRALNELPDQIRASIDMELFDDMEYLLRYIVALHDVLSDVSKTNGVGGGTFEF